jgi:AcrR family transcriptional regulator
MTRREQRAATRTRILAVAREQLEARGFEATALRDIAQAAGVATGTLFVHFTDKHDLLAASLHDELAAALVRAVAASDHDLEGWLDAVTAEVLAAYTARPVLARALLREALLAGPPWRERFAALIGGLADAVVARVTAEQAAGTVRRDADPRVFAGAYVAFLNTALILWVQEAHPDPRRFVRAVVHQQLEGVR